MLWLQGMSHVGVKPQWRGCCPCAEGRAANRLPNVNNKVHEALSYSSFTLWGLPSSRWGRGRALLNCKLSPKRRSPKLYEVMLRSLSVFLGMVQALKTWGYRGHLEGYDRTIA